MAASLPSKQERQDVCATSFPQTVSGSAFLLLLEHHRAHLLIRRLLVLLIGILDGPSGLLTLDALLPKGIADAETYHLDWHTDLCLIEEVLTLCHCLHFQLSAGQRSHTVDRDIQLFVEEGARDATHHGVESSAPTLQVVLLRGGNHV